MTGQIRKTFLTLLLAATTSISFAQFPDFGALVASGSDDLNQYMGSYVRPFMNTFGTGVSNGWYNTAEPHKSLGFDLTIYASFVSVPDADRMFTFNNADYNSLQLVSGNSASVPTLLGPSSSTQLFADYTDPNTQERIITNPFDAPGGVQDELPTKSVPVPMVQLGLGIVKNTEIMVRYTPSINVADDFKLRLFGLGLKHDIKQWIPGLRSLPIDLSILIGYTNLDSKYTFPGNSTVETSDGEGNFDVNSWTFQALVSKKLSVVTFYGGLGYNSVNSTFNMLGTYTIRDATNPLLSVSVTDPVDQTFPLSGFRATVGIRLKLAVFTFHGDYTLQEYSTITAGFGISVR